MIKKVILITQSASCLAADIANTLIKQFDKVLLIAGKVTPYDRELNKNVILKKIYKYNKKSSLSWITSLMYITERFRII